MVDLSVIMPCHNEMHTISSNISETVRTLKKAELDPFELIVIDDGSSDGTFQEIIEGANNNGYVRYVQISHNQGKGHALRRGFENAQGRYICFLDGDLDLHPRLIGEFMKLMDKENADVVIGSKRHPRSMVNYPLKRRVMSISYQWFITSLFNLSVRDTQVGLKLFKREVLEDVFHRILVKKYAFDIELLVNVHRNNYKIVEAPIEMDFMNAVGSDVNLRAVARMFVDTCAIFYRSNVLHYYDNGHDMPKGKQ